MKIHFCDLCNESVPQADLDEGSAVLRKGRVVCRNCEAAMSHEHESQDLQAARAQAGAVVVGEDTTILDPSLAPKIVRAPRASAGATVGVGIASVALIFTVGAATFLFEEMRAENALLHEQLSDQRVAWREEVYSMEERLTRNVREAAGDVGATRFAVESLDGRLVELDAGNRESAEVLRSELGRIEDRLVSVDALRTSVERNAADLSRVADTAAQLHDDVLRLGGRIGAVEDSGTAASAPVQQPTAAGNVAPEWSGLLTDLDNQNSGKRWQAVQSLGSTADPAVAEYLVPMLKDPDIFVRMATARILGDLEAPIGIPSLIDALEDPEASVREAAVVSLRSVTGKSFKFDPGAKEVDRAKRVKAWREWWKKSADDFIGQT